MALTSVGLGSGLDINGIVSALVKTENDPKVAKFDVQEGAISAEISALGTLKSSLSEFQDSLKFLADPESFESNSISLSTKDYLTATIDETAVNGSYSLKVDQLAVSQKVGSAAVTALDTGTLNFAVAGENFDVDVTAEDTLESLVAKINNSEDNVGVTATIVTSDAGAQLVLTSNETGTTNNITVTAIDTGAGTVLADTFAMSELQTAKDSIIYIDGLKLTSSSNKIEGAISGVTLELKDADIDKTTTLKVEKDTKSLKSGIESFVKAFNALSKTLADLTSYDAETKKAAVLQGDALPRSIQSQLRGALSSVYATESGSLSLAALGITTQRDGSLAIDDDVLDAALSDNLDNMKEMFTNETTGVMAKLDGKLDPYVNTGGIIDGRDTSLDGRLDRLTDQREDFALKMQSLTARLYKQYNKMDALIGSLNSQSNDIKARLDSLPGLVRDSK
ncbi:flagellar filament capping protein FliD [Shewanella benthica]|uniref:flagellar filament capping protein FliD n=1 Tax=Shewanella benthica TaxID=43661 RepID=UPI00187ABA96|nr:flagellar filament capping protein FliD [Shewanella benthica]MBE7213864.1 flagellar filament capping protein FliD [Shewanella benthica]MCL1061770.1 flagellar filament capping protein FliD [Shewanella benthica]